MGSLSLFGGALVALMLAAGLTACPAPDPAGGLSTLTPPDQFLDYNEFVCNVQPVLAKRCSYLACHGVPQHALRIYSPGKLRLADVVTRNDLDAPISAAETELNFESASGIVYSTPTADRMSGKLPDDFLISKPLAARFGGSEHHGLGIFPAYPATTLQGDAEYLALVNWVAGKKQPSPVDAACASYFANLGFAPKSP